MTRKAFTILTCDRCGREQALDREKDGYPDGWVIVLVRDNEWSGKDEKKDLCISCTVSLYQLLEGER